MDKNVDLLLPMFWTVYYCVANTPIYGSVMKQHVSSDNCSMADLHVAMFTLCCFNLLKNHSAIQEKYFT